MTPDPALDREQAAQERAWIHDAAQAIPRAGELRGILLEQLRLVCVGDTPPCAVCRFHSRNWSNLYRCYQCGLWLCPMCCLPHFPEVRR